MPHSHSRAFAFRAAIARSLIGLLATSAVAHAQAVWPDSAWRQIGPASFGGRVDDIEAVTDEPRTIFVGTASGGVFRSLNNGTTWTPVFDAYGTTLSIGDIAIAPSDRRVVWLGTGEANNRQSSTWGDGVYRSLDGGATWQHMGLRETQSIGRIVIDPHDPNTVFVAAVGHLFGPNEERGLYRTRDGGTSWKRVLYVDANTGVGDVAIAPDGYTLFAATYERRRRAFGFVGGGPGGGLWRSLDGGETWTRLTNGLPTGDDGRIGIAIAPSNSSIVYAVIENRNGGVFRSNDGGTKWTRQNPLDERPSYYSQIRVDPADPDRVWLLGTNLYRSVDGGRTFSSDSTAMKIHPDHHALWIDPRHPDHMLLGNDGGVYATYDGARHWDFIDNLPIGQFYDVAVDDREPYWIYGGLQDNGTLAFPSGTYSRGPLTDAAVMHIGYGDGFQVATDPSNPRLVYTNSQNGRGYVFDLVTRQERRITPVPPDRAERYRFNWNTAILVSPNDPHVYYFGANRLLETSDHGTTWTPISPDLTRKQNWRELPLGAGIPKRDRTTLSRDDGTSEYGNITTISESPRAAGTLYIGTDDGNVQMSADGGAHWTNLTSRFPLAAPHTVSAVLASRFDARTAYVAFDGHTDDDLRPYLFRTTDGGATWTSIAGDLPNGAPIKTVAEDPRNPQLLFAGTEFGLYCSTNGGRHWRFPGGALPHVMVDKVVVDPRTNDLVLATYGRGVVILDDIAPLEDRGAGSNGVKLFPIRAATEVYQWRDQPAPGARKFAAPNVPLDALISYAIDDEQTLDTAASVHIRVLAGDGTVVRELTGPATPGVHRIEWDLRTQFAFVPPPADSGYYGTPRAAFVPAGRYTVRLTTSRGVAEQPVDVRTDPKAMTTPDALRARWALAQRVDSLSRAYLGARRKFVATDSEVAKLRASLSGHPHPATLDSTAAAVVAALTSMRSRFGSSYPTPIGQAFDVLGGVESSWAAPTVSEVRALDNAVADLRDAIDRLNRIVATDLPKLRAAVGQLSRDRPRR